MTSRRTWVLGLAATPELLEAFREGGKRVADLCGDNIERWALHRHFGVYFDVLSLYDDCSNDALTVAT